MSNASHNYGRWQSAPPEIIQGGMGAGVSNWELAKTVAKAGQLGVVSGTALDLICARRLQAGDKDGHIRRALAAFPVTDLARHIEEKYFIKGGKAADQPFKGKAMVGHDPSLELTQLLVVSSFVEVFLAKEGHDGRVGINVLEKIQAPNLPTIYGAMLAGVDVVTMGAGVPTAAPGVMDKFAAGLPASVDLHFPLEADRPKPQLTFDPACIFGDQVPKLPRPVFLPIIAAATLAVMMMKKCPGGVDGFVIETPTAGGHNAPPRGRTKIDEQGEPIYGKRDLVDYEAIKAHGIPFWIGGSYGSHKGLLEAKSLGAVGIQVGTLFAFSEESGLEPTLRQRGRDMSLAGEAGVFTDPVASPTGFPFKVLTMSGTNSERDQYEARKRVCDLGYLRHSYRKPDGGIGWRCASEPLAAWVKKGGDPANAEGRKCLCNGLMANIGLPQYRSDGTTERALLTAGDDVTKIRCLLSESKPTYSALDVIDYLLANDQEVSSSQSKQNAETD